jgi:geranylgeranyl pyrophosphate synthase
MEEGVYTLPVLHTLAGSDAAAKELRATLGKPLSETERLHVLDIVRSGNGVTTAIERARLFVADAERACDALPQSNTTDAMRKATAALLATVA